MIREINKLADTRHAAGVDGAESWALQETNKSQLTLQLFKAPRNASTYKGRFEQVMACSDAVGRLSGNALSSVSSVIAEKVITLPGEITIGLLEMIAKHFIGNSAGLTRFFNTCKKANTEFFGVFAAPVTIATQIALRTSALALGVVAASLTVGAVAVKDLSAWSWNKIKAGCNTLAEKATQAWAAVKPKLIAIGKALGNAFVKTAKFLGAVIALALLAGVATITDAIKFTIGLLSFLYRTIQWNFGGGKKELAQHRLEDLIDNRLHAKVSGLVQKDFEQSSATDPAITVSEVRQCDIRIVERILAKAAEKANTMRQHQVTVLINKKAPLATLPQRIRETSSVYAVFKNFQKHQNFQAKLKNSFGDCFRWETTGWHPDPQLSTSLPPQTETSLTGGSRFTSLLADSSSLSSLTTPMLSEEEVERASSGSRQAIEDAFDDSASPSAPIRRSAASFAAGPRA
jgi:hypothetical protein